MKKQFDLFGLKKFDNMVDNDDADLNLRDQFYSQSVKEIKQRRKQNKRVDIYIVLFTFFLLVLFAVAIALSVTGVSAQAEAAEESSTASEVNYYNYTITCNNAPLFFQSPSYALNDAQLATYYRSNILGTQVVDGFTLYYTDMIYVLRHLDGTIYYQNIVRITNGPGIFMDYSPGNFFVNYNSTVGASMTTTSFTTIGSLDYNLYAPNVSFSSTATSKLKFFFSAVPGNVTLNELVLSAINLHDFLFYSYNTNSYSIEPFSNGAPWLDFYFTQDTPNSRQIQVATITSTESTDPTYPIIQSYDSIFNFGYNQGYNSGYNTAYDQGYNSGFDIGSNSGYNTGFNNGYNAGEDVGFNQGVLEANDYSFLGLLTAVVDAPVTVIRETFDFNILGFNLSTFIFSLLTICLVIALIKKLV